MAGNPLPPWGAPSIEPKRKFKYQMTIGGIPAWSIITSSRPKYSISSTTKHNYLGHEFKFPGRVTYEDITVTLVDMINVDVAGQLLKVIESSLQGQKRLRLTPFETEHETGLRPFIVPVGVRVHVERETVEV